MHWALYAGLGVTLLILYLWYANGAVSNVPPEALKLVGKTSTEEEIKAEYQKIQIASTDVRPYLHGKKGRRYVVCGGSGSVGSWIAAHLLMRGEDPAAVRIFDLNPPTRTDLAGVTYIKINVTDTESVAKAFDTPWPASVRSLPLTVFHTVAYISPAHRDAVFLTPYRKVNIEGTRNVLNAARKAGATCFIATSSASVGLKPPSYFPWPWQRWPRDLFQFVPNADPKTLDKPLQTYGSCYAWSKAQAEKLVRDSDSPEFRTGAIRPGHGIYGHGVEQSSSITWDYIRRGGTPTWIHNCVANFVNNQNVSIGHLAFEDALLKPKTTVGGNAYCVCDPSPPFRYRELYRTLELLAHPSTPVKFADVPHMPLFLMAHVIEAYQILQLKFLSFLPPMTGDLAVLTPAMWNMAALHLTYTDTKAQEEIGYRAPITTQEGFALAVKDWNDKIEAKLAKGQKDPAAEMQDQSDIPMAPKSY